jgi:hypothetical protein
MLDLDCVRFEPAGLIRQLQLLEEHRADGVFGMSVVDGCEGTHCFYDIGAVDAPGLSRERIGQGSLATVQSAFSGFGLYSAGALRRTHARYNTTVTGIEHIPFNHHLLVLVVNGSFRPVYRGRAFTLPGGRDSLPVVLSSQAHAPLPLQ